MVYFIRRLAPLQLQPRRRGGGGPGWRTGVCRTAGAILAAAMPLVSLLPATAAAAQQTVPAPQQSAAVHLAQVWDWAEDRDLTLRRARRAVVAAQRQLGEARAAAVAGGPTLVSALTARYGLELPPNSQDAQALVQDAQWAFAAAELQWRRLRRQTRTEVMAAYYQWGEAEALLRARRQALGRAQGQSRSVAAAAEAGLASPLERMQAEAQVAAAAAAVAAAESDRMAARLTLEERMGRPLPPEATSAGAPEGAQATAPGDAPAAGTFAPAGAAPGEGPDLDSLLALTELLEQAESRRLDAQAARVELATRRGEWDLLRRHLPAGDLRLAAARRALQDAAEEVEAVRRRIAREVPATLEELRAAQTGLQAARREEQQVRRALELTQLRFEQGLSSSLEVLTAQEALSRAEAARIQAEVNLALAQIRWHQALGLPLLPGEPPAAESTRK